MTTELELEILNLIIQFKPAGIHKNFRMLNILLNSSLNSTLEITEIIQKFYNLSQLSIDNQDLFTDREFLLPDQEFSSIIEEYRLQTEDDVSRDVSPQRSSLGSKRDSVSAQSNQQGKRRTRNTTVQASQRRESSKRKRSAPKSF
jgi:hypothetical protein